MVKVSVVIPIYNGEAYLRQCLDSVCEQTLKEIEIICVDDGSTDASGKVLEEYREKDSRFQIFRQENQRVAAARNNGLAQAQGKYVIFWDCDDFFEPRALELLYLRAEETEADICVCKSDLYTQEDGKRYPDGTSLNFKRVPEGETFNRFTNPEHILDFTNAPVWNKLLRRSFLVENDLTFPNFHIGEDRALIYIALCLASRIATVKDVLVHYRWNNPESLMGKCAGEPLESFYSFEFTVDQLKLRDIVPAALGKMTVRNIIFFLSLIQTEEDFIAAVQFLREGGLLEKLDIREREPGYYTTVQDKYIKSMLYDKPGDVLAIFMHNRWQEFRLANAEKLKAKAQLRELKNQLAKDAESYEGKLSSLTEENERLTEKLEKMMAQLEVYEKN